MKNYPVKQIFIVFLAFFLTACGFQINRNRIVLPYNAQSLSLNQIENKSFIPRLDIHLRNDLTLELSDNGINQVSPAQADLLMNVEVLSSKHDRSTYSLNDQQIYKFTFKTEGVLTVEDQRNDKRFIENQSLIGEYQFESKNSDLSQKETTDGRRKSIEDLAQKIANQLTRNF